MMKTISISTEMLSTKALISAAASAAATAMLLYTISKDYIPRELRDYIYFKVETFFLSFSSEQTFVIEEYDDLNYNHLFQAVELYLEPIIPPNIRRLKISLRTKDSKVSFSLEKNEEITDTFNGISLKWKFITRKGRVRHVAGPDNYDYTPITENRVLELSFHKKYKNMVLDDYIKHVIEKSKEIKEKKKTLKLFTLRPEMLAGRVGDMWQSVNLEHPATFHTLAMDTDVKKGFMEDLERFVKRKDFYKRVGKSWKRGYLFFGPPGTGKSSLIAAMANYLQFDIYDLDLTCLRTNTDLRRLLISTGNKSILVVEDIDCSIGSQNRMREARVVNAQPGQGYVRENQVTLSGLLNFIDGLWSSCGDERIIVFTTNHKEKLDPALLRPGRMDMHIHMFYCTPCGFRMLAANYLGMTDHPLFTEIEELIEMTNVTPAEIGEQLMKSEHPETALTGLIEFMEHKTIQDQEEKRKKREAMKEAQGCQKQEKSLTEKT